MAVQTHESTREREINEARKSLEDLRSKRAEIEAQIEAKELLIQAWTNFELTLQGKFKPATEASPKAPRAISSRAPRGARAELRKQILTLLKSFPSGLEADAIYTELKATDKKDKQKIANLLVLMKKESLISQEQKRGPYKLDTPPQPEASG